MFETNRINKNYVSWDPTSSAVYGEFQVLILNGSMGIGIKRPQQRHLPPQKKPIGRVVKRASIPGPLLTTHLDSGLAFSQIALFLMFMNRY